VVNTAVHQGRGPGYNTRHRDEWSRLGLVVNTAVHQGRGPGYNTRHRDEFGRRKHWLLTVYHEAMVLVPESPFQSVVHIREVHVD
jgi:hypothetical protein